ncbi:hypothetical protein M1523_04805 [Patescibacteria group bacterium]|nr:hypothetical protein [Patescibacteria group bacterium]
MDKLPDWLYQPLVVLPKLVEQPTWGGDYIIKYKDWGNQLRYQNKKIGQSYELCGESLLQDNHGRLHQLSALVNQYPRAVIGEKNRTRFGKMPLLIKLTQALGNSFQLHVKAATQASPWLAKPESWYFFEAGYVSCGIKPDVDLCAYQAACRVIERKMAGLSRLIKAGKLSLAAARTAARQFIKTIDPWQFVNVMAVDRETAVDLSAGGIHHSWEDNRRLCPQGNIVYEVQLDVPDSSSTIRCFDQGKISNDGTVRPLHVADYFRYLDRRPANNCPNRLIHQPTNAVIFQTKYYRLGRMAVNNKTVDYPNHAFVHLFIKTGQARVVTQAGEIVLNQGHGGFICACVNHYQLVALRPATTILRTDVVN